MADISKITTPDGTSYNIKDATARCSIPFGQVDSTSTATAYTATVTGITSLFDGVCVYLLNGTVTSAAGFTLNINNLGAKPVYTNLAAATSETTKFNINYTMLFVYNSSRVEGGCWDCYNGYDSEQVNSDWNASSGISEILNKPILAAVATSGSYDDLSDLPTIPTDTSELTNGAGFITSLGTYANTAASGNVGTASTASNAWKTLVHDASLSAGHVLSGNTKTIPAATSSNDGYMTSSQAATVANAVTTSDISTTAPSSSSTDDTIPTSKAVWSAIETLPEPMLFKGTVGTGGTVEWSTFPSASSSNEGFTYKVLTDHSTTPICKVGDTLISNGSSWVVIPSGDEPSGTVTNVATGVGLTGGPITSTGTIKANLNSESSIGTIGTSLVYAVGIDSNNKLAVKVPWSNTDTLVKQTAGSSNDTYPLLASAQSSPTSGNSYEAIYDSGIKINPNKHSFVSGNAADTGTYISATGSGSSVIAAGVWGNNAHIVADSEGAVAFGNTGGESDYILSGADGSLAGGAILSGSNCYIETSGDGGAVALGCVNADDENSEEAYIVASGKGATAMGCAEGSYAYILASGDGAHAEGYAYSYYDEDDDEWYTSPLRATNVGAHAEGYGTYASGKASHAEGYNTKASEAQAHAEGLATTASGINSHAEGNGTTASSTGAHAEGVYTLADSSYAHAEGYYTRSNGSYSHSEGYQTLTKSTAAHAEGYRTVANGTGAHSEGYSTRDLRNNSIVTDTDANIIASWQGTSLSTANSSHFLLAKGSCNHAEGMDNLVLGDYNHAEGRFNIAMGSRTHVEGSINVGLDSAHVEGGENIGAHSGSHTEGGSNFNGMYIAHAEGGTNTIGVVSGKQFAHVEGTHNKVTGQAAHAEGGGIDSITITDHSSYTKSSDTVFTFVRSTTINNLDKIVRVTLYYGSGNWDYLSFPVESVTKSNTTYTVTLPSGVYIKNYVTSCTKIVFSYYSNLASGDYSHAEGSGTTSSGTSSHSGGIGTVANQEAMTAIGKYNANGSSGDLFAVGYGGGTGSRRTVFNINGESAGSSATCTVTVQGKVNASQGFFQTSDINHKNVKGELNLDKAYDLIDKCQTIIYTLKEDKTAKELIGLIAQEVREFFPEIVSEDENGVLSLDYARLTVVILKVLKDLIKRVSKLESKK